MKKIIVYTVITVTMFTLACMKQNPQTELDKLKAQHEKLTARIEHLESTLEANPSDAKSGKLVYVKTQKVIDDTFRHFIRVQGTVASDNNILLPAQTSGVVKKIHVRQGDTVEQGDLMAELDGSILERNIAEIESSLDLAQTLFERQSRLWEKKIGSEVEYLQSKNNVESMKKRLEAITEQYRLTKIVSHIDGTVDEIHIKEGEAAVMGLGAIRILQLSDLKIEADLSEAHILGVKRGDPVDVEIPVLNLNFQVAVDAVSQVIDPDNRTFGIEIRVPKHQKGLIPNMLTILTINDYKNTNALIVPRKIVQKQDGQEYLFVARSIDGDLQAEKRFVKTGQNDDGRIEILNGLTHGETVVIFGYENLSDRQPLEISDQSKKTE
ncbi:MAG: efflux RND transporter periplasmic adaptor subunit [Deltaproteobacteria bacterium]|nr:efflux RND transporter periplasmic adaptor subunit [Deltaproteobacteria bacterium]